MSIFIELTSDEMDDLYALCITKSRAWDMSGKTDSRIHAKYYACLAAKFVRADMEDK